MTARLRFAHLSDWHATSLVGGGPSLWRGKRLSGYASWALGRRRHHDPLILDAAQRDVHAQGVDHALVTGDLTHVGLEQEFHLAARQLRALGDPERVFLIPGNHDCYVAADPAQGFDLWAPYLRGTPIASLDSRLARHLVEPPAPDAAPRHADYPTLRVAGRFAAIGLCSAIPTRIFRAGGLLGGPQLERLEGLLEELGRQGCFRVVMVHHPVAADGEPARRALWDGAALRSVLGRAGAELVVHGHKHRRRVSHLPGPSGEVPIVGVPSTTERGSRPDKPAQYHLYTIDERAEGGFALTLEVRGWQAASGTFERVDEIDLG